MTALRERPLVAEEGGRGRPAMVRATTAVACVTEAQAFARDVLDAANGLQQLGAAGSRAQIVQEAGRLGQSATAYLAEFRRLAGGIDS